MFAIIKFQPSEIKPTMIRPSTVTHSTQYDIIDTNGNTKTITAIPSVWEYNRLFFLVVKYNQGTYGILTLTVKAISPICF